jgi:hypothetical protein
MIIASSSIIVTSSASLLESHHVTNDRRYGQHGTVAWAQMSPTRMDNGQRIQQIGMAQRSRRRGRRCAARFAIIMIDDGKATSLSVQVVVSSCSSCSCLTGGGIKSSGRSRYSGSSGEEEEQNAMAAATGSSSCGFGNRWGSQSGPALDERVCLCGRCCYCPLLALTSAAETLRLQRAAFPALRWGGGGTCVGW